MKRKQLQQKEKEWMMCMKGRLIIVNHLQIRKMMMRSKRMKVKKEEFFLLSVGRLLRESKGC